MTSGSSWLRVGPYVILLAVLVLGAPAVVAARRPAPRPPRGTPVPNGFVGMNVDGPLLSDNVNLDQQFDAMVASGVQSIRVVFNWAQAQPYPTSADVPPDQLGNYVDEGGVPTDFEATDAIVAAAAARGLTVLPTVIYAPGWDLGTNRQGGAAPPADPTAYGNYLRALIGRYGPNGTLWETFQPRRPIRAWQIWNEPNLRGYWSQPFASSYVALLRVAHAAIKAADPGAQVVLGALANNAWTYLRQIYRIPGAHRFFDAVAINGFTSTPSREIFILRVVRGTLNRLGDRRKPLLATEVSWPSAAGKPVTHHDWDTTERGQARNISRLMPLLAAARASLRLASFYYFTWASQAGVPPDDDFSYAGLLRYEPASGRLVAKPALAAFRNAALRIERCRQKGSQATQCVHRAR